MTENTATSGAGDLAPATTTAPKSDAEAALQASNAPATEPTAEEKAAAAQAETERQEGERKKNRTREYINRINGDNAELRRRLAELESRTQPTAQPQQHAHQQQADDGPTLEQFNYDLATYQRARDQWVIQQAEKGWTEKQKREAAQQREEALWSTYESRTAQFADEHPDFLEVVGSIRYPLTDAVQAAIAAHDKGPMIAYHLGNNDDDAFQLASIHPQLAGAAVERLAARLGAAQTPPPASNPPPVQPPAQPPTKPISQAPPPVPTVSGRSPTETPPEKLTDDQWYAKDREKRRKR
jgi:hypothetical protein